MSATTADTAPAPAPGPGGGGPLRWDGSAGRLVLIGLGNLMLSMSTLGLYRFWGVVRFRRHIWAHQEFLGSRLEYSGTGGELFRGFLKALLVLGPVLLLLSLVEPLVVGLHPAARWAFLAAKLAGFTFFVGMAAHAARRYIASRTLWRGLRFQMDGSPWRFGLVSLGWTALTVLSLGLAHPFAVAARARWMVGHLRLGTAPFAFDGSGRSLLRPWLVSWGLVATTGLSMWLLVGADASRAVVERLSAEMEDDERRALAISVAAMVAVLCALPGLLVGWFAWTAATARWLAERTTLCGARFAMPGATGWAVFRLAVGNLLVSGLSFGLLHPVTMARNAAFRARHLRLAGAPDLSAARQAERGPGTGEGVADLFGASAF